jgi:uncharacterized membrane protein
VDQRRKIFWFYICFALFLPVAVYAIWSRGFRLGDQWIIGTLGLLFIGKLIWAWREQRLSNKRYCFLCGLERGPSQASPNRFLCDECDRLWLVDAFRRLLRKSN